MNDEQLERENERLSALNSILLDTAKSQEKLIKQFRKMLLVVVVCFAAIICCMTIGFFWYESQFETTTTTTTTTDMNTSGDNANINNVTDGDMYNDNAVHNE